MSSPTVDYFRKTSPSAEGLSDEELTLQIYDLTRDDPVYDEDQEFVSQAKSLDTKRAFGTATRNIGRSLVGIPGGIVESVGIPLKQVSNITGIPTGGESLISLGRGIRDIVAPPDLNDPTGFWRTDVASGLGSMTGFMAGGAVGKALKIPAMLTTGVLGAGVQGAQAYDDAIAHGASDGTAFTSYLLNLPIGATEMLPLAKMLDRFDKATAGTLSRTLFTAIKEGSEEGLQEFFQQPASNAIAKQLYDENREIWEGAAEGGAAGGILGFAASLIVSAAGGKVRAPVATPPPPPTQGSVPPPAVPIPPAAPVASPATQAAMASARTAAANVGVGLTPNQTATPASVSLTATPEELAAKLEAFAQRYANREATTPEDDLIIQQIGDDQNVYEAFVRRVDEIRAAQQKADPIPVAPTAPVLDVSLAESEIARKLVESGQVADSDFTVQGIKRAMGVPEDKWEAAIAPMVDAGLILRTPEGFYRFNDSIIQKATPKTVGSTPGQGTIPQGESLPPTPIEPVNPEDLTLIVSDYLNRLGQIPNPTEQQVNRRRMIEAIVRTPTAASAQNLAALFNLQLDPSATEMPSAYGFVERPMPSSAGGMLPGDAGIGMRAERRMMATPPDIALENARRAAAGAGIGPAVTVAPEPVIVPPTVPVAQVVPVVPPAPTPAAVPVAVGTPTVNPWDISKAVPALETRIGQLQNLLINSQEFGASEFYSGDFPIPDQGGIVAAKSTQRYANDPAYRKSVDASIRDITDTIVRANKQRMTLLNRPSSGAFGVDYAVEKARAGYTVNVVRAWHNEAKQKYPYTSSLGDVSIREGFQNSLDAVLAAKEARQIKSGLIKIETSDGGKSFAVDDNGIGMSDLDIGQKFLSLHSTGKAVEGRFGGFGIAKAVILGPSETAHWTLHTRDNVFNHDLATENATVQTAERRQGTRIEVKTQDFIVSGESKQYIESTELPKGVQVTFNGEAVNNPFKGKRAEVSSVRVNDQTTYDLSYFPRAPEGYNQKYLIRLVDSKTGAKLTQAIKNAGGNEFSGTIIVDIKTTALPGSNEYPLVDSRMDLKWNAERAVSDLVAAKSTDVISAKRGKVAFEMHPASTRSEWKDTIGKVGTDQDYQTLVKIINKIWEKTGKFFGESPVRPFTPLGELLIKRDTGFKGYSGGTLFHAKHLAAYEAVSRLFSQATKARVTDFYGLLSKQVEGTTVNAEHGGGGQMGLNFLMIDKTALKSPISYALYLRDLISHELTHEFHSRHDENFTSKEIEVQRASAHLFPYVHEIAKAVLGQHEQTLKSPKPSTKKTTVETYLSPEQIQFIYDNAEQSPIGEAKDRLYYPRQRDAGQSELGFGPEYRSTTGLGSEAEGAGNRSGLEQSGSSSPTGIEPGSLGASQVGNRVSYESQFRSEPGLSTATVTTKIWNAVLDAIRMAGIPVRVLNTAIAKVQPEYRKYANGDRLIIVGMNYQTGPTAGNFSDLLHEGGHALWATLPQDIQDRLDRAVGRRSIMRGGVQVGVSAEETIVENTTQAMADEGFNPAEARGYAQQLWRFIKGLMQRLAMAVQEALFGRASQNMAEAYFKNQMESWLAGVPRPFSIIQFLGGGRPRPEHVADALTLANGSGTIAALWDADNEQMVYPDVLIDGRDALAYTSKYRWQGDVSSPLPVVNETNAEADQMPFIATTNEVSAALESAFTLWAGRGQNRTSTGATLFQTFQQFFEQFLHPDNYLTFPGDLVADINAELSKVNKGPVQPDLRVTQIQEASAQMRAATQAITILRQTAASLASRRADSQSEWNKNDNQIKRVARQINRAATHYTDVSDIVADAKFDIEDIFTRFRADITNGVRAADKMGGLGQVIKQLVGDIDSPVDTLAQFRGTLERLYTKINGAGMNSFVDMLDTVSKLNLPWDTLTVPQLKALIEPELQTNPLFAPIQISDERTALLGILIAFGKQNSRVIDYLQLRAVEAGNERTAINEILKEAVGDSRDSISRARILLNRVSKYQLLAGRLIDRIEKMRADNLALVQTNRSLDSFIEFHDQDFVPAMNAAMRPMEQIIGAQNESWEPTQGAIIQVPPSPTATIEQVMDKTSERTLTINSGQRISSDTEQWMNQQQAWLDEYARTHPGEKGSTWNTVNLQLNKLRTLGVDTDVRKVKHNFVIDMLGSLRDKLDVIGLSATRELSKRLAWLDILHLQHSRDATVIGNKWDNAESAALKEANRTVPVPFTLETFRDIFFHPALKLAEDRKDISLVTANQAADETATLTAIRGLLLDNPGSRQLLQANPKLWPTLDQFYRAHWKWGVEGTFKVRNSMAKTVGNPLGATIQDDVLGLMRKPIGNPIHTSPRMLRNTVKLLWQKMRPDWVSGYATSEKDLQSVAGALADEYDADPALMAQRLQGMFTPEVWRVFVREIVQMPRSAFNGPIRQDGTWPAALRTNIQAAYQTANGDVLAFVEALSQLESGQAATSGFIGETLSTFQAFFNIIHGIYTDLDKARDNRIENPTQANGTDIDHFLMDSRKSEALPAGFLEYATFGAYDMQRIFQRFAEHESFGRDATAVWSLFESAKEELLEVTRKYAKAKNDADTRGTTKKQRDDLLTQLLGGKQARYIAERAAQNLKTLGSAENDFDNIIKSQATTMVELKAMAELMGVSPAAAVQSLGTSFMDLISHFQPLRTLGLSSQSLQMVGDMSKASAARVFGSFLQVFGIQIGFQADKNTLLREEGFSDPDEVLTLREKVGSIVHSTQARTDIGKLSKAAIIAARTLKSTLSTGVPQVFKTNTQLYPTLKPAVFTYTTQVMQGGSIIGVWDGYERMILKAVRFFRSNPLAQGNTAFRFAAADLGYRKGILLNDEFAFDAMRDGLERQGVGSLEGVARDAIRRQDMAPPGAKVPVMTRQQMQLIGFIGPNEILQDASLSNRPTWMTTNPILKQMTTLLGWSMTNFKNVITAFREPGGENSYRAARKGLVAYAALIPIGIAFAMLRDEYDERVLGKKANVLGLGEGNNAMAIIDMLDRAGTFGIGGNAVNSLVNQDINREFSLDSRVFFASSLLNTGRALSNWVRQGEATWGTVYRPLISGLGGSAFLQNADVINNAMSLDNAESRAVARISVNNYLRAVGRTLDLDVRLGRGQRVISNTIKPWVSEMLLAAYSNDMAGFAEAYRNAVTAAREAGNPDPADHVKRSYSWIHPLRVVYQTMPSEAEYRKILNALPANGREAVQEAIYRYNRFGERIGVKPSFGREEKAPTLNMASVRSRAALAFSGF